MTGFNGSSVIFKSLLQDINANLTKNGDMSGESSSSSSLDDNSLSNEEEDTVFADKILDEDGEFGVRVPKYFQAIITLLVCFFLLFATLAIIQQVKKLCIKVERGKQKPLPLIRVDSNSKDARGEDTVVVRVDDTGKDKALSSDRHFDYYKASPNAGAENAASDNQTRNNLLTANDKRVRFERRLSGPFGDDAMDFAQETYGNDAKYKPGPAHGRPPKPEKSPHESGSIKDKSSSHK